MDMNDGKHTIMSRIYHFLPRQPFQFVFMFLFVIIIALILALANSTQLRNVENLRSDTVVTISYFLVTSLPFGAISGYFLEQIIQMENINYPDDPLSKKVYRSVILHIKFAISNILVILLVIVFHTITASLYSAIIELNLLTFFSTLMSIIILFYWLSSLSWTIPVAALAIALTYSFLRKLFYKPETF